MFRSSPTSCLWPGTTCWTVRHCNLFPVSLQLMYRLIYEVCLIVWHLSLHIVSLQFMYACFLMEVGSVNSKAFRFRLWEERNELHLEPLKPHVKKSLWVWHKKLGKTILNWLVPFCLKHGFGLKVMFVARNTSPFTITNGQMCFGLVAICSCILWPRCHNSKGGYYVNCELCLNNWSKFTYICSKQFFLNIHLPFLFLANHTLWCFDVD